MLLGRKEGHYYFITPQIGPHEKQLRILQDLQTVSSLQTKSAFMSITISISMASYRRRACLHDSFRHLLLSGIIHAHFVMSFWWRGWYNNNYGVIWCHDCCNICGSFVCTYYGWRLYFSLQTNQINSHWCDILNNTPQQSSNGLR